MNPPKNRANTITRYRITEENLIGDVHETVKHYDLLSAIMVYLGEPGRENYDGILKLLDALLSPDLGAEEKKRALRDDFASPMTEGLEREVR